MTDLLVRSCGADDEAALLALHNDAFGPPRWDARWLAWRFRALPAGGAEILGAFGPDGECRAMYAGVRHRLLLDGDAFFVLNQGDVAVSPELRRGLGGPRLLLRMAQRFFESFGGGETGLMYGLPEPGLRRIIVAHLRSEVLTDLTFLAHDLRTVHAAPAGVVVTRVEGFDADADLLWARFRGEVGAALVRDAAYRNVRYRDHPGVAYALLEARDAEDGALRGLAVLRDGGWDPHVATLNEWLAPFDDAEAEAALVAAALDFARTLGRRGLVLWFPTTDPRFLRFQTEHGFLAHPTPYQLVFRSYRPRIDRRWLHENWYQTLGDVDFF